MQSTITPARKYFIKKASTEYRTGRSLGKLHTTYGEKEHETIEQPETSNRVHDRNIEEILYCGPLPAMTGAAVGKYYHSCR